MFLYDEKDKYWAEKYKWHITKSGHVQSRTCRIHTGYNYFHRLVMNAKPNEIIDHINENPLDNRRENLRIVDKSVNELNSSKARPKSKTGVRGITLTKNKKYRVRLTFRKETYELGVFESLEEAQKAYQDKKEEVLLNV